MSPRVYSTVLVTVILSLFALVFLYTKPANAGTVDITWTYDTSPTATCVDGVSLAADHCPVTHFKPWQGTALTGTFTPRAESIPVAERTVKLTNVLPGNRCFSMVAYTASTNSIESGRVCTVVPSLPPKAPAGMTIRVVVEVSTGTPTP
jgi:hypothetical protein